MKRGQTPSAAIAALAMLIATQARALDDAAAARAVEFSRQRLAATAAQLDPASSPNLGLPDGGWATPVANTDLFAWTQGFFPGSNWYVYDLTGDAASKSRADQWTRALEVQKSNTQTHDLGFKLYLSFGHAYRSTGDPYYKNVLLAAAGSLATRFDPTIGAIICCDWNPDWHRPTVVDTMMNIELLLWGAQNGGPRSWRDMAVSHALKTLADIVRPDGSTYHVVDYSTSGAILFRGTSQGYSDSSTWTRGQAWAIYGFTMAYRYTSDPGMLAAARKVTDYYLARLGTDPIPNWDFDAPPPEHRDSAAAAAVASALFELSGYVGDPIVQRYYLQSATRMLDALASPAYLSEGTSNAAILLHGVANLPAAEGVDVGLSYGDHYFLEALARRPKDAVDAGDLDAGVEDAGAPDSGEADGGSGDAGAPDAGVPDAGVAAVGITPSSQTVAAGAFVSYAVTTAVVSGSSGGIALAVSGLPAGVHGSFDSSSVVPGSGATLTVAADADAASVDATSFTVTGLSGGRSTGASATVAVTGAAVANTFSLSLSPDSATIATTGAATYTVTTAVVSGSAESIALTVPDLPDTVVASFDHANINAGHSATLTLTSTGAAAGTNTFTVLGTASSHTAQAQATVVVFAPGADPARPGSGQKSGGCSTGNGELGFAGLGILALIRFRRRRS